MIYAPREDSFLLERVVSRYAKGKKVLDMGTGSGIIGTACIRYGAASVTFADINPNAISQLRKKGVAAVETDLFSEISESFDLIAFNPPYLPADPREDEASALATTGGKNGDELLCRFMRAVSKHLNPGGKILVLLSSLTPRKKFDAICKKQKFTVSEVAEEKFDFEKLFVLLLEANSFKPTKKD